MGIAQRTDGMAKGGGGRQAGLDKEWRGGLKGCAQAGRVQGRKPGPAVACHGTPGGNRAASHSS
jgi:hypothetical protein